jgi:hypothetical protein
VFNFQIGPLVKMQVLVPSEWLLMSHMSPSRSSWMVAVYRAAVQRSHSAAPSCSHPWHQLKLPRHENQYLFPS